MPYPRVRRRSPKSTRLFEIATQDCTGFLDAVTYQRLPFPPCRREAVPRKRTAAIAGRHGRADERGCEVPLLPIGQEACRDFF